MQWLKARSPGKGENYQTQNTVLRLPVVHRLFSSLRRLARLAARTTVAESFSLTCTRTLACWKTYTTSPVISASLSKKATLLRVAGGQLNEKHAHLEPTVERVIALESSVKLLRGVVCRRKAPRSSETLPLLKLTVSFVAGKVHVLQPTHH
ncbi:hypothetical protein PF001_g29543 [Phytophthora fragariae]|uniref:Uncharacterized protein n=1 Tax=Phytophthora fragariae TaxID=53985 RepID=A0A6A4BAE5_9STRA|nr:hypothetical protein PF001_g29543 [Phytophthora fragariae]